jgi:hypothetical protein
MKNRDVIITVVVVILIGWLVIRHFCGTDKTSSAPQAPAQTTEKVTQQ